MALRRNVTLTLAAITTSAVALFLLGAMAFSYLALTKASEQITGRFDIRVFMPMEAMTAQVTALASRLRKDPGVATAIFIPRGPAWAREKQTLPPELTEGVENPLPHAFKVTVRKLEDGPDVADRIGAMPEVEKGDGVRFLRAEARVLEEAIALVRWLGGGVGALLLLTGGVLIYNTIRLTVEARSIERSVMRRVGASWKTIYGPYVIEGMVTGAAGGAFASLLVLACHAALQARLSAVSALGQLPPLAYGAWLQGLVLTGAAFGLLCSLIALTRPERR